MLLSRSFNYFERMIIFNPIIKDQIFELLEFLCVDLHNQCDNAINQCYFILALWSIMGLDTLLLDFYGLTLNSLDWPIKSSGLNCVYVMWYIWIYLFIYIYIHIYISAKKSYCSVFLGGWKERTLTLERTHRLDLGYRKRRAHWTRIFTPSQTQHILEH